MTPRSGDPHNAGSASYFLRAALPARERTSPTCSATQKAGDSTPAFVTMAPIRAYFLTAFFFAPTVFFGPLRVRALVFVR
jgi:hypothetical protein